MIWLSFSYMLRDDLLRQVRRHILVPDAERVDHDDACILTASVAPGSRRMNQMIGFVLPDGVSDRLCYLLTATLHAAPPIADEYMLLGSRQIPGCHSRFTPSILLIET